MLFRWKEKKMNRVKRKDAEQKLQTAVRWALGWLYLQAGVFLLASKDLATFLHMRGSYDALPLTRAHGATLLCLAFLLSRGLMHVKRQYLALDALLVLFLAQAAVTMTVISEGANSPADWVILACNLAVAVNLYRCRVKPADRPSKVELPAEEETTVPVQAPVIQAPIKSQAPAPAPVARDPYAGMTESEKEFFKLATQAVLSQGASKHDSDETRRLREKVLEIHGGFKSHKKKSTLQDLPEKSNSVASQA